jgi:Rrf2 family iron-sulfur cluster assembly transcriptional regulator
MWLSSTAQYALRATLHIAEHAGQSPEEVGRIASALAVPRNYLSKTLHLLARAGVLRSVRGPGGGYQLVDPPDQLTIADVVAPFAPPGERRCLLGRAECGAVSPCAAHHQWSQVAAAVEAFFAQTTIADLLGNVPPQRRIVGPLLSSMKAGQSPRAKKAR